MKIIDNIIKYIDNTYITDVFGKKDWAKVEEQEFYIGRASTKIRTIIFANGVGNPDDITTYTPAQQAAIKEATAIYTLYYFDMNYDFTSGSISISFGGANMSESRQFNGEPLLSTVFDLLKTVNLIPVIDVINFNMKKNKPTPIEGTPSTPSINDIYKQLLQVDDATKKLSAKIDKIDVKLDGTNTFTGINTFTNIINVPTPTMLASATPRQYVDDLIAKIDVSDKASLTQLNNFSGTNNFNGKITTQTEPINNIDIVNKLYSDLENSKTYAKSQLYTDKEIAKIPSGKIYTGIAPIIINDTNISLDETGIATQDEINSINAKLTPLLPQVQQIETELTNKASLTQLNNFSGTNNFNGKITTQTEPINNIDIVNKLYSDLENSKTYAKSQLYTDKEIAKIPSGKIYTGIAPIIINDTNISLDETGIATQDEINSINAKLTPLLPQVQQIETELTNKASLNGVNDFSELNIFRKGVSFKNGANVDIVGTNPISITNRDFVEGKIGEINTILTPLHQDVEVAKVNIDNLKILTTAQTIKIDTNKSNIDVLIDLTTTNKTNIATHTTEITNINAKFIKKECRWTGTNLTMDGIEIDPTIYAFMSIVSNSTTDNWTILNRLNSYILYKLGLDGTLIKETRAINIWCAFIKF